MPTYEYQCRTCGHRFEYFQSMSSPVLTHCTPEVCKGTEEQKGKGEVTRRVSGGAGLVFKGEGFYLTDYVRKSGEGESKSASSPAVGDGASKSEGKSEANGGGEADSGSKSGGEKNSGGASESKSNDSKPAPKPASDSTPGAPKGGGAGKS